MDEKLMEKKRKYLLDERGMIRKGITSMDDYAEILYAESDEELEKNIAKIMERERENLSNEVTIIED